jgi:adenylate/guanylate cyclase family protein
MHIVQSHIFYYHLAVIERGSKDGLCMFRICDEPRFKNDIVPWKSAIMISSLNFSRSEYSCILLVDIVDSTKTVFQILTSDKLRLFYKMFITELSRIAMCHDAIVVKNVGDSIICYYPSTKDTSDKQAFKQVLECGVELIKYRGVLNCRFIEAGLPSIDYRVSADYGKHEIATDDRLNVCDMFSQTLNMCSKMKPQFSTNQLVIGGDLHEIVKSFSEFAFDQKGKLMLDPKRDYPLYSVVDKRAEMVTAASPQKGLQLDRMYH